MRCRVIAVTGPKGATGCTFVAVGLASRLAAQRIPTLLVDADEEEAGVASQLDLQRGGPTPFAGLTMLRSLDSNDSVRQQLVEAQLAHRAVVIDLGHQAGEPQRALAAAADWLLWVVAPDRIGVERADRAIGACRLNAATAAVVINRAGYGFRDAGAVLGERHGLPLAAVIPERPRAAREAIRRSLPPDRLRAFRRPFDQIARCVHPDAAGQGGPAWP